MNQKDLDDIRRYTKLLEAHRWQQAREFWLSVTLGLLVIVWIIVTR